MTRTTLAGSIVSAFLVLGMTPVLAQEMIINGSFEGGKSSCGNNDECPDGWTLHETRDFEDSQAISVADNGPSAAGSQAWECRRNAGSGTGDWTTLEQALDVQIEAGKRAVLKMDVYVHSHSLEAGGWSFPGWEWPVEVLLSYRDSQDVGHTFMYGFYLANPGDGRADDGHEDQLVPADTWVAKTIDLTAAISDLAEITKIRVGGSGWAYSGRVDNISLNVSEIGLIVDPKVVQAGDAITFTTFGGQSGNPVMLFLTGVNHAPFFSPVASGTFGGDGLWTLPGVIPNDPGLPGSTFSFRSYALGAGGTVVLTNEEAVQFQ